jgi:hypothetical protein
MADTSTFEIAESSFAKGVGVLHLPSWRDFVAYIHEAMAAMPDFIWRGQRGETWRLEPGLERVFRTLGVESASEQGEILRFTHLKRFKLSTRGRLDPRDLEERLLYPVSFAQSGIGEDRTEDVPLGPSPAEREENNWWAVGQHYGLKTPLLDWSTSPFVASFFAFSEPTPKGERTKGRAIYGLHRTLVAQKSDEVREKENVSGRPSVIDFIEPLYKDNPRLVSQGGLFTRVPNGISVREWVEMNYNKDEDEGIWLLKIILPDENRDPILRSLNRMNINHQSLFPDLYGATEFVNVQLVVQNY